MSDVIMDKLGEKVDKSLANLKENLNSVRAGRAKSCTARQNHG